MAKKVEKKALKKGTARFNLVGEAVINNYSFKLNEESGKSDWLYSMANIGVDCGNGNKVYAELMGGYGTERDNVLYCHGKKPLLDENKEVRKDSKGNMLMTDDFDNQIIVDFEDRLDKDITDTLGDLCFITVGLEQVESKKKDNDGNPVMQTVYEKFLSAYDAIEYISEHLESGMVINVSGNIKFQTYEDTTTIKKEITSIALSKAKPEDYRATFQQTILLDKDSIGKKLDRENNSFSISARVLDYLKIVKNGKEIFKGNAPFYVNYEVELNEEKPAVTQTFLDKVLKVKKDITEITVEGNIVEGSSLAEISDADIDPEILSFIEAGILDRDEVVGKMAVGSKRVRRWIITKPMIKKNKDNGGIILLKTEQQYTEDDLDVIPFAPADDEELPWKEEEVDSDDDNDEEEADPNDWLNALTGDNE